MSDGIHRRRTVDCRYASGQNLVLAYLSTIQQLNGIDVMFVPSSASRKIAVAPDPVDAETIRDH
jgi:hypothetical protein